MNRLTHISKNIVDLEYLRCEVISVYEELMFDGHDEDGPIPECYELYVLYKRDRVNYIDIWYTDYDSGTRSGYQKFTAEDLMANPLYDYVLKNL